MVHVVHKHCNDIETFNLVLVRRLRLIIASPKQRRTIIARCWRCGEGVEGCGVRASKPGLAGEKINDSSSPAVTGAGNLTKFSMLITSKIDCLITS